MLWATVVLVLLALIAYIAAGIFIFLPAALLATVLYDADAFGNQDAWVVFLIPAVTGGLGTVLAAWAHKRHTIEDTA
jgi:hypothetical protein